MGNNVFTGILHKKLLAAPVVLIFFLITSRGEAGSIFLLQGMVTNTKSTKPRQLYRKETYQEKQKEIHHNLLVL